MPSRSGFHSRSTRSPRRKMAWVPGPASARTSIVSAVSTAWSTGVQINVDGLTLVRTRGVFTVWQELATAAFDGFEALAIGICIVNENAAGVGATAIPSPITDTGWDGWLYHSALGSIIGPSTTELLDGPMTSVRHVIDSKAMWKVKSTDFLVGMVETGTEIGTASLNFTAETRLLFKLP